MGRYYIDYENFSRKSTVVKDIGRSITLGSSRVNTNAIKKRNEAKKEFIKEMGIPRNAKLKGDWSVWSAYKEAKERRKKNEDLRLPREYLHHAPFALRKERRTRKYNELKELSEERKAARAKEYNERKTARVAKANIAKNNKEKEAIRNRILANAIIKK